MFKEWKGFVVPLRDSEEVLNRRVGQCQQAVYELRQLDLPSRVIVQAGANWGCWPLAFAQSMFETVYTFEPDGICFECLCANTRALPNIVRLQAALGLERELVGLWRDVDTTGNQRIDGSGIYPTLRIDDLALPVCDLIYLDIEGQEHEALRGAVETIKNCRPTVIFEARKVFQGSADASCKFMRDLGYTQGSDIGKDIVMRPS